MSGLCGPHGLVRVSTSQTAVNISEFCLCLFRTRQLVPFIYLTLQLWRRTKLDVAAAQASIGVTGCGPPSAIHVFTICSLNVLALNLSAAGDQMRRCSRMQETVLTLKPKKLFENLCLLFPQRRPHKWSWH